MKFAVYDIETRDWTEFRCGTFYDGEKMHSFTNLDYFVSAMLSREYRGYHFFAHYGGIFDVLFVLDRIITNRNLQVSFFEQNGKIIRLTVKDRNNHIWTFRDTSTYFKGSLEDVANDFELDYKKYYVDYNRSPIKTLIKYNQNDCAILYQLLEKTLDIFEELGVPPKLTIASTAYNNYMQNYCPVKLKQDFKNDAFVRQGYFGGRVEDFKLTGKDLRYYDKNSMYAHIMATHKFPISKGKCCTPGIKLEGFTDVTIKCPDDMYYPVLPFRVRGKLLFPTGTGRGVFCNSLLRYAVTCGYEILKCHKTIAYQTEAIFAEWVYDLYEKKKVSTGALREIYKLLLNTVYGKFAEAVLRRTYYIAPDSITGMKTMNTYLDIHYKEREMRTPTKGFTAISAFTTSFALEVIHRLIVESQAFYCDTDAVVTAIILPVSEDLGGLSMEHHFKRFNAFAPKVYWGKKYNDRVVLKAKGVSKRMRKKLRKEILGVHLTIFGWEDKTISLQDHTMKRFKSAMKEDLLLKAYTRTLKLNFSGYNKRKVGKNGITYPFDLGELD